MSLFNESIESIAQAIVTVKRALKAGVIEEENYKGLNVYLAKRSVDFKVKKSHIAEAKRDLGNALDSEVKEFFMKKNDALYNWAEELLEDFNGNDVNGVKEDDWDKQAAACKAWAKMNDKEREAMAVLASEWQKSR
jgi:hypothetical protein